MSNEVDFSKPIEIVFENREVVEAEYCGLMTDSDPVFPVAVKINEENGFAVFTCSRNGEIYSGGIVRNIPTEEEKLVPGAVWVDSRGAKKVVIEGDRDGLSKRFGLLGIDLAYKFVAMTGNLATTKEHISKFLCAHGYTFSHIAKDWSDI